MDEIQNAVDPTDVMSGIEGLRRRLAYQTSTDEICIELFRYLRGEYERTCGPDAPEVQLCVDVLKKFEDAEQRKIGKY